MGTTTKRLNEKVKSHKKVAREWALYLMNCQTNELKCVMDGLNKDYALLLVRKWKVEKNDCVLYAWPEWLPEPVGIEIAGHPPCQLDDDCSCTRFPPADWTGCLMHKNLNAQLNRFLGQGDWSLYTADVRTGRVQVAMESLSKEYAMLLVQRWNAGRTECVLIAWPNWAPDFRMSMNAIRREPC